MLSTCFLRQSRNKCCTSCTRRYQQGSKSERVDDVVDDVVDDAVTEGVVTEGVVTEGVAKEAKEDVAKGWKECIGEGKCRCKE